MEILLELSKRLGSFVIQNILPCSFKSIIEPGSDLSAALGAFIIAIAIGITAFLI